MYPYNNRDVYNYDLNLVYFSGLFYLYPIINVTYTMEYIILFINNSSYLLPNSN